MARLSDRHAHARIASHQAHARTRVARPAAPGTRHARPHQARARARGAISDSTPVLAPPPLLARLLTSANTSCTMCTMKTNKRIETEYDPMFTFRLPQEHFDAVVDEAEKRHLKASDILRELAREWYERKRTSRIAKASSAQ